MDGEDSKLWTALREFYNLSGESRIDVFTIVNLQTQAQIFHEVQVVAEMRHSTLPCMKNIVGHSDYRESTSSKRTMESLGGIEDKKCFVVHLSTRE